MQTNIFAQSIIEAFCALISVNYGYHRQPDTVQLHLMNNGWTLHGHSDGY
jgi:hypothetical protein